MLMQITIGQKGRGRNARTLGRPEVKESKTHPLTIQYFKTVVPNQDPIARVQWHARVQWLASVQWN